MRIIIAAFIFMLLLVGSYFVVVRYMYAPQQEIITAEDGDASVEPSDTNLRYETYTDPAVDFAFSYRNDADGYAVDDMTERITGQPMGTTIVKAYRVMNVQDRAALEASVEVGESVPTITILVFSNDANQTASQWVDAMTTFSNINSAIGVVDRDAVVGGANAVRYRSDGLYQNDVVVVAHGAYMYLLVGAYDTEQSRIYQDFQQLVNSIQFMSVTDTGGTGAAKIDVRVACESALAYMSFPSGVEAEAFVAECVAGDHPEVIDRYISDMGLDGARI